MYESTTDCRLNGFIYYNELFFNSQKKINP